MSRGCFLPSGAPSDVTWIQLRNDRKFRPIQVLHQEPRGAWTEVFFRDVHTGEEDSFLTHQVRRWVMDHEGQPVPNPWPRNPQTGLYEEECPSLSDSREDP